MLQLFVSRKLKLTKRQSRLEACKEADITKGQSRLEACKEAYITKRQSRLEACKEADITNGGTWHVLNMARSDWRKYYLLHF